MPCEPSWPTDERMPSGASSPGTRVTAIHPRRKIIVVTKAMRLSPPASPRVEPGQRPHSPVDAGIRQIDPQRKENPHAKIGRQIENAIRRTSGVIEHANRLAAGILVPQGRRGERVATSRKPRVWCELTESN